MKNVLITGITGMDGSVLADYLINNGYAVYGLIRHSASPNMWRINHLLKHPHFHLIDGDITSLDCMIRALELSQPAYVFNLAAQSFVPYSWSAPLNTLEITGIGPVVVLEAIRNVDRTIKFYQASSSEMFGKVMEVPQTERTPFYPRSPYGVAKVAAHYATINYNESFGIHASSGILFNHEHERRGKNFVTRKITSGVAEYFTNKTQGLPYEPIKLGNLDAKRDWGYAEDYVKAMYKIVNYPTAESFVIATGVTRTIRELCETCVKAVAQSLNFLSHEVEWKGEGTEEIGYYAGEPLFVVSKEFYRPAEVDLLLGDASKAKALLNWEPETSFEEMISRMVNFDLNLANTPSFSALS